jgi:GH35 family endo-1,4-beta-xylanase
MDVDVYMGRNIIGRLGKPRLRLIRALCYEKYGDRNYTADEMNEVIDENQLSLYNTNGSQRKEKQIQDAMTIAHKRLKG